MENIEIRLLKPTDRQSVIDFIRNRFSVDGAPLISHLKPPQEEVDFIADYMVNDALMKSDKITSFIAIDKIKGSIIGCGILICEDHKNDQGDSDLSGLQISANTQSLIDFNRLMWSGAKEFLPKNYTGPYLRLELGLVEPEYRRFGLLRSMTEMGFVRAWKFGCKFAIANCTSHKTQKYGEQEGWVTLRWINYADFYVLGKRLFNFGKNSHEKCAKLMMVDIKKWLARDAHTYRAKL